MRSLHGSDLRSQGLRLTRHDRDRLTALAIRLRATAADVTAATVARGLCLVTLDLAMGAVNVATAEACRIAARDPAGARNAVNEFVFLLDVEPPTTRMPANVSAPQPRESRRNCARERSRPTLQNQALRLPQPARDDLEAIADVTGVSATEAMRGLCLLALDLVDGVAGSEVAAAMCIAAIDPTPAGSQRALEALRDLLDGEPPTIPAPPVAEPPPPSTQRAA